jgi:hypothetical protein
MANARRDSRTDLLARGEWGAGCTSALLTLILLIGLAAWGIPRWGYELAVLHSLPPHRNSPPGLIGSYRLAAWLAVLAFFTLFMVLAGKGMTGRWCGLFVDPRNQISLSRVQTALWTNLVLSAWIAAVFSNYAVLPAPSLSNSARVTTSTALDVAIPAELWAALGISLVSLVGSPLILSTKRDRIPDPVQRNQTIDQLGREKVRDAENAVPPDGVLITKSRLQDAQFSDLFRGEETGNGAHLDLAKVQMFFFTLALLLSYALAIGAMLLRSGAMLLTSLPVLSAGFVTLLGISHAGYLTSKAVPHSKEADTDEIAYLMPAQGPVGAVVTLYGSGFGTTQGERRLLINGAPVQPEFVRAWTDDQIQFVIPPERPSDNKPWASGSETARIGLQGAILNSPDGSGELRFRVTPASGGEVP